MFSCTVGASHRLLQFILRGDERFIKKFFQQLLILWQTVNLLLVAVDEKRDSSPGRHEFSQTNPKPGIYIKMFSRVQWKLTCWWWWWKSAGVTRIIRVHPLRTLISNVQSTPCLKRDFSLDGETLPPLHITACMRVYKTHSGCFHHFVALPRLHSVTWERVFIRSVCW